ncbi:UDP-glycosyltransferase 83A1-like [Mangifera indica]|uniref:UDP-glycosyltransferase 83A1-like n=1 Tax=Mangifera indica TaxID=29780 RepID=UPI001CFBCE4E|nr:UDP-glycosyltransferase 83A1-like [Mangifera indica]
MLVLSQASTREKTEMTGPHILVIPFPAQGHVIPLLELSHRLVKHGLRVTFVSTDHVHKRIINALQEKNHVGDDQEISLVSISDGLEPWEDRNDLGKLCESLVKVMPGKLEEIIKEINNKEEGGKITCVIADVHVGVTLEVAEKLKIKGAAFMPMAAAALALYYHVPKMINDGIINKDGTSIERQMIKLGENMPAISSANLIWNIGDLFTQRSIFQLIAKCTEGTQMAADYLICNTTYELETEAFNVVPKIIPIGPLLASNREGNSAGHFWPEDSSCLAWLDQQEPNSVAYVAFGSFTVLDKTQFQELALGLELTNKPFLWVVRPDITDDANEAYPEGFTERVANRGKMVGWAPQQKVLSHPSIACFMSHCGWNSTMEGVSNGLPFLCWPYFADQFINETYIADIWMVGLKFNKDENGIISREEIKRKVDQVLGDENFKARASELQEFALKSTKEGGPSNQNFKKFIDWLRAWEVD